MGVVERKLREREARVELILSSALKVFAERGIKEATMDEIAEAAELGKGTIYYYFPSKEAIIKELVTTTVDHHFNGILEKVRFAASPWEVAEGIIARFVANYKENPELFRLFYMVLAQPPGETGEALRTFAQKHSQWLERLEGKVSTILSAHKIEPKPFIGFIGTLIHGITLLAVAGRDAEELKEESLKALRGMLR